MSLADFRSDKHNAIGTIQNVLHSNVIFGIIDHYNYRSTTLKNLSTHGKLQQRVAYMFIVTVYLQIEHNYSTI